MNVNWLRKVWRLPWSGRDVPHALLDVNRQCNLTCRSCYNLVEQGNKPLAVIEQELDSLLALRRLDSVSIVGGEPTLHNQLVEIVELITRRGLHSELFTNGVLLDEPLAEALAEAGLGMAFLHIQKDQQRQDWPLVNGEPDLDQLIADKTLLLHRHGIQAGLTVTAHPDRTDEILHLIDLCLENPLFNCLLVTLDTDVNNMGWVAGNIVEGMTCLDQDRFGTTRSGLSLARWAQLLTEGKGLVPFCYLGSNRDRYEPRWLSFCVVCGYRKEALCAMTSLRPSWAEKGFMAASRRLKGRYPFFNDPDQRRLKFQLGLNTFLGGKLMENLNFIKKTFGQGTVLSAKRILFQVPAEVGDDGIVVFCRHCPDAVLKNGRLVPVCISDQVRC